MRNHLLLVLAAGAFALAGCTTETEDADEEPTVATEPAVQTPSVSTQAIGTSPGRDEPCAIGTSPSYDDPCAIGTSPSGPRRP